jgi:hypothetical protein
MYSIDTMTSLFLGQRGEDLATEIRVDMSSWLADNADLICYVTVLRHGETVPYIAGTTMEERVLVWPVSSADTAIIGTGLCAFVASNGTSIVKSKRIRTSVGTIVPGSDDDTAPEPIQGWIDTTIAEAARLQGLARDAANDAEAAQTAAEASAAAAAESEENTEGYMTSAQGSAATASTSAAEAALSAQLADLAADGQMDRHGIFYMSINDAGHLIYHRTTNLKGLDFKIEEGRLKALVG